jgi:hypothetical protein
MGHRVAGWQLNVAGGNLVTGPGYGMDPVTGEWGPNSFPDRTDERLREDLLPHWGSRCLRRLRAHSHDALRSTAA